MRSIAPSLLPRLSGLVTLVATLIIPALVWAQDALPGPDPSVAPAVAETPLATLALLVLVPLLLLIGSAFIKVSVVLGLLRSAFGSQDVPPPMVVTALAVLLSLIIMGPVLNSMVNTLEEDPTMPSNISAARSAFDRVSEPLVGFLERNSDTRSKERFAAVLGDIHGSAVEEEGRLDVLLPAFVVTELTEAFQIALLLLLPFLVLDIVVAAVLQSAGLGSATPSAVSLPLKLVLFLMIDGWQILIEGLLTGYT